MITVFRIEAVNGDGPYWSLDYDKRPQWMNRHNESAKHPRPRDEFTGNFPTSYNKDKNLKFGFEYEHQLYNWFEPEARGWLKEKGFRCMVYSADEYTMFTGKLQCAFKQDTSEFIREIPL